MSLAYCAKEQKPCVRWVEKYFKDCLCNLKDEFSFGFGLISLVCWGVAEIPQIITNFRTKSSHAVSLLFLLTWVAGDVFNLVGCLLEPATLPTQFYTALLYTTSTVALVLQGFYYDHIYRWWKYQKVDARQQVEDDDKKPLKQSKLADSGIPIPKASSRATPCREYYYTSARSMAGSGTPPFRSYLKAVRSGPSAMGLDNESSSDDEVDPVSAESASQPRPIPRSAGYGTFLATTLNLPLQSKALTDAYIGFTSRRLLHEGSGMEHSAFGQWLGWLMAAIYMGGRIPQIWLNIKRGSVEGLNPLMFIFALMANLTYVLSILVRTTEWDSIKANMPWLLDAAVCVALDLFIILQYIYYRYIHQKS
ncbi:hypothetical protein P3X46_018890 [Hevea brasiliensis]|uniref:Vacuolar amino acid transporter YPQ1 n=1 Tax=Hevea brasiliensis TaxID=3981 RepID=A0ABQ9LS39_HEVBR|nr:probable vacuolar amino acid transporter YPQ1 isoform X2 [Hevea brasiliensis]KAJ9170816.1 hypothetical protein P3X46_018890 [Hevea brasiliensis]